MNFFLEEFFRNKKNCYLLPLENEDLFLQLSRYTHINFDYLINHYQSIKYIRMKEFGSHSWVVVNVTTDCEWKAQAGNICIASFDWRCSGICKSDERIKEVHRRCGEGEDALWS